MTEPAAFDTPEATLLRYGALSTLSPSERSHVTSLVRAGIDWDHFLAMARRHRLVPLLFRHYNLLVEAAVPNEVLDELRQQFKRNASHSQRLLHELREILLLFQAQGIALLPYKGPVLAHQLYGNVSFRQMDDLDLLVSKQDFPRALELLLRQGYYLPHNPSTRQARVLVRDYNLVELDGEGTRPHIELHKSFSVKYPIGALDLDEMLPDLRSVQLAGLQIPTFPPEDLLLVLCFHGARHLWERLAWLSDVTELIRTQDIDWNRVFARAARFRSSRVLRLGLALAEQLLHAPLPADVLKRVQSDRTALALAAEVRAGLFVDDDRPSFSRGVPFHRFQLRAMDQLRSRLYYAHRSMLVPGPEDWDALPLPDPLFPLYYVLRPIRLALAYSLRLMARSQAHSADSNAMANVGVQHQ
jgi:hypothetical protein